MSMVHSSITPIADWQYVSPSNITDDAADEVAAAPGSGKRNLVAAVQISNSDVDTGTLVNILSGSTLIWTGFVNPFVVAAPGSSYIQAVFPKPLKGGVNEAINVQCGTTAAAVRACVQGFVVTG